MRGTDKAPGALVAGGKRNGSGAPLPSARRSIRYVPMAFCARLAVAPVLGLTSTVAAAAPSSNTVGTERAAVGVDPADPQDLRGELGLGDGLDHHRVERLAAAPKRVPHLVGQGVHGHPALSWRMQRRGLRHLRGQRVHACQCSHPNVEADPHGTTRPPRSAVTLRNGRRREAVTWNAIEENRPRTRRRKSRSTVGPRECQAEPARGGHACAPVTFGPGSEPRELIRWREL